MAATLHVDVVSAEEQIYSGEAEFVVLPGMMGELGIYPRHTPLFTQIKPGAVRIKVPNQAQEEFVFIAGGFLEVTCCSRRVANRLKRLRLCSQSTNLACFPQAPFM